MTKVFKIKGFLADPNGFWNKEELIEKLESISDLFSLGIEIEEKEMPNWEEASEEEIKKLFNN